MWGDIKTEGLRLQPFFYTFDIMKKWMKTYIIFYLVNIAFMIGFSYLYNVYMKDMASDIALHKAIIFGAIFSLVSTVVWAIIKPIKTRIDE